jgi:hypothetical protein
MMSAEKKEGENGRKGVKKDSTQIYKIKIKPKTRLTIKTHKESKHKSLSAIKQIGI